MLYYILMFFIGSIMGSFLNATAIRISNVIEDFYEKNSIKGVSYFKELFLEFGLLKHMFYPIRSQCPNCKTTIKWYHNIPILSYIFLKGKCAYCETKIPIVYLFSEIIVGIIYVLEYYYYIKFNIPIVYFICILISLSILYIGIVIDMKTMLIPDVFIILSALPLLYINYPLGIDNIKYFAYIFILSYIIMFLQLKFNKHFIGIQDIKLYGISVLLCGIDSLLDIIFISNILALLFFLYKKIKYNKNIGDFGIYIYITMIIYPLLKIYGLNFF